MPYVVKTLGKFLLTTKESVRLAFLSISEPFPFTKSYNPFVSLLEGFRCSLESGLLGPNIEFFLEEILAMSSLSSLIAFSLALSLGDLKLDLFLS